MTTKIRGIYWFLDALRLGTEEFVAALGTRQQPYELKARWRRTTNTDATKIYESEAIPDNTVVDIEAKVIGVSDDGAKRALYHFEGTFYRDGGNITQQGATTVIHSVETDAGLNADFTLDTGAQKITVEVVGLALTNMSWTCVTKRMTISY